jgi:clostripain
MKATFRIPIIALVLLLLVSTIPMSLGEEEVSDLPEWTFLVYLDSDNNLESAGIEDMNEMETVGSSEDVNIIVQMDRTAAEGYDTSNGDWTGAKRYYVTQDDDANLINSDEIEDLGEVNMGDPKTLVDFFKWTIDNYPAKKYAISMWNHGGAFWGVCWDEDNDNDHLSMVELKSAFAEIEEYLGRDIDLVGFDACLMAQVAVMYQISDSVDLGGRRIIKKPGEGWPYEKILPKLVQDPEMSPSGLGIVIANEYVASYTDREGDPDDTVAITQAVFDLEKFSDLVNKLDELAMVLSTKAGTLPIGHNTQIRLARESSNSYDLGTQVLPGNVAPVDPTGYPMYDVIDLMDNIIYLIPGDPAITGAANAVKSAANDAIIHFAVNTYHGYAKGANGLTIYFPSGIDQEYDEVFDEVDFAIDTYWDEFLHHYYNRENVQNTPPGVHITAPSDDDEVDRNQEETISIQGSAFDAQGEISLIEISIDGGEWISVGASNEWYHDLSFKSLENGNHTVVARSFDGTEYSAESSVKFFIVGEKTESESGMSPIVPGIAILAVIAGIAGLIFLKKRK